MAVVILCSLVVIFPLDYWLAVTPGYYTISITTWIAEAAHPTLILGINSVGWVICLCLAPYEGFSSGMDWMKFATLILVAEIIGHLCTSEGAASAVMSSTAWKKSIFETRRLRKTTVVH
jgi:hypothetical protein